VAKRITVARTTDIPVNEARAFPVGTRMIAVFNRDGVFHAMDDFCPHMGASLAGGWIEDNTVACPWHAWRFSLDDGCWLDNPKIKVDIFSIHIEGDEIQIEIDDE
jgi:nitrite reductase (NADH) small subunit/3-phenylpropionate/trans-cinnamate dioxygenase ferredoxin subunit